MSKPALNFNIREARADDVFRRVVLPRLLGPSSVRHQIRQLIAEHLPVLREQHSGRKPALRIAAELLDLGVRWRCLPFHYFRYGLYDGDIPLSRARAYLPEKVLFSRLLPAVNRDVVLLDDKIACKRILAAGDIPQPRLLATGGPGHALLPDGTRVTPGSVLAVLAHALPVVLKPARYSSGGHGVMLLAAAADVEALDLSVYTERWGAWLLEEYVAQAAEVSALNPQVTNTFRVITCLGSSGPETLYCMLKLGGSSGTADNSTAGGMQIRTDPTTGRLDAFGYDRYMRQHRSHPATGVPFAGHTITTIKDITAVAERAAALFPQTPFIGWDIALSTDGPTVIEGNSSPSLAHIQRTHSDVASTLVRRLKPLRNRPLT